MIKIFTLPSHQTKERTSGVDMVRVIQPMQHLNKLKDFEVNIFDINDDVKKMDWETVAKEHDIIYLNYIGNAWAFAMMGTMARKYKRKIVFDLDDNLWNIGKDNPAHKVYHPGSEGLNNFTSMCNEVDYMTTTSLYLKHAISHHTTKTHDRIKVFPNYIDFDLYTHRSKFKDTDSIRLLHFGSTTHFISLQKKEFEAGIDKIFKDYPNVTLQTVGAFIPRYKNKWGVRYENDYGDPDVYKWIKDRFPIFVDRADMMVVPLEDNVYNRCKSSIKYIESASASIPGVWQKIRQYSEVIDGTNGLLADTADEWYNNIKLLIENKKLRRSMGKKAHEDVKKNWRINTHVNDYADFFREVIDN